MCVCVCVCVGGYKIVKQVLTYYNKPDSLLGKSFMKDCVLGEKKWISFCTIDRASLSDRNRVEAWKRGYNRPFP